MDEAAILDLINEGRDSMTPKQKKIWDSVSIHPESWLYRSPSGRDNQVWVVALIGRSVISYNDAEGGFDRSQFLRYGEIAQLGWGNDVLEVAVQDVLNEFEFGRQTAPIVSEPKPGTFSGKN